MDCITDLRDEKLALAFRQTGDSRFFTALWNRHHTRLAELLSRNFHRPELDVELLIAETFETLLRFLRSDSPLQNIGCWLRETAKHAALTAIRQNARQKRGGLTKTSQFEPRDIDDITDPKNTVTDDAVRAEQAEIVHAAVSALPRRERQIVQFKLAGLTDEEAGIRLGIPKGTVKSSYARARRMLREALSEICA
jgi:RNA polymerase sigma-70 factor (ECF subfamily)